MSATIQGEYGKRPKGFLGGIANSNPTNKKSDVAGEDIKVGKVVSIGVDGVVALTGANSVAGVVVKSDALKPTTLKKGSNISLLKGGSIFVNCETACNKGEKVFARFTANGELEVGDVRADVDVDKAIEIAGVFAETLDSAGLVEIEINL